MESHEHFLQRCFELAVNGTGHVAPNPLVGCVVVKDGQIIGEGWHREFGGPHAEVHAIVHAIQAAGEASLHESTLYVNLEPCAHHGKTPPCADLIIARGIKKVVISNRDPFEAVNGKGIEKLRAAGIDVSSGILEKEGAFLNRRFFTFHKKHRPYIILKYAQTSDGFIAPSSPDPNKRWISGPLSKKIVHKWRAEEAAIMVGSATAVNDNPQLTVREWKGRNPVRIVIDRIGVLPARLHVLDQSVPTLVYTTHSRTNEPNLEYIQLADDPDFLNRLLGDLHRRNIQSVIVEGGRRLLQLFIDKGYWDEARIFTSRNSMTEGIPAPAITGNIRQEETIGDDRLTHLFPA